MNFKMPPVWLIVLIAGLPQLSETVYTPSLPVIAQSLHTSASMMEYTLTIYLFGFAIGTLIWGKFSDRFGRKPGILLGLLIFIIGCTGCYYSTTISGLMISRFVQAFGGSIGSVLGQAICRDAFQGSALGKVYSVVGSALAVFPAVGPVVGGFIAEHLGWRSIFTVLALFSLLLIILVARNLPETHLPQQRARISLARVAIQLLGNKKVMGFALLVAGCNGISFSYFAEGPFYFIKMLGLSPSQFGMSFIAIAISTMSGGLLSKYLHAYRSSGKIMQYGLMIILIATLIYSFIAVYLHLPARFMIIMSLVMQMTIMFGVCMVTTNALALALTDFKWCIGTASSVFGFFYYSLISVFTLGMGYFHNGTLQAMPLYFLAIGLFMFLIEKWMIKNS
ncbi:multidrug resistance protein [Legionella quinlivanii]|uniref:Bcr/CflA family efflux transporter n=1 Tax=Legionella quinlivanii TaxID=45073 RepID=A0A0W0Y0X7_9GAMM|nr:multidrug effflux MFS transporter [Legionella quinlivanii]KTD50195.1 multidrug resistance protein [Legionella quinlivanii]MCW8450060.1 multidrug effflux MFS transporter [Legionella quinlivanii]SEF47937.1 drug resistance transporter, Bcr/CflA subfamily [Legionella quinlivanii DSM 21216]STY11793.1 multidrug resistance protein [Legionella quinlivanii]